jgi:hypothetical protein
MHRRYHQGCRVLSLYLSHGPADAALPSSRRRNPLPSAVHVTTSSHRAVLCNASLSLHEMVVPREDILTSSPACKGSDLPRKNGIAKQGSNSPPTLAAHQASHDYLWETFLVVSTHSGQRVTSEAGANGLWAGGPAEVPGVPPVKLRGRDRAQHWPQGRRRV